LTVSATDDHAAPGGSDALWRWLVGGLAAGGAILGLLIGAYAIGYDRGKHHARTAGTPTTATTPTTTGVSPATVVPVIVTPALAARGKALYTTDGCVGCHSLSNSAGAGPALNGLAGSTVTLADGSTVTADDAYLERAITDADAEIVKGYRAGVMPAAVGPFKLGTKPGDVRALVAYLKSQK
jgi:mono/diheme cytochrome c family protein